MPWLDDVPIAKLVRSIVATLLRVQRRRADVDMSTESDASLLEEDQGTTTTSSVRLLGTIVSNTG